MFNGLRMLAIVIVALVAMFVHHEFTSFVQSTLLYLKGSLPPGAWVFLVIVIVIAALLAVHLMERLFELLRR